MFFKRKEADKSWNVEITICENIIMIQIANTDNLTNKYCYYLYDVNNTVIEKSRWVSHTSYCFKIEKEGTYFVKVFKQDILSKTSLSTQYVDYYSEQTRNDFENFCGENKSYSSTSNLKADYLYKMKAPYKDFAAIISKSGKTVDEQLLGTYGFKEERIEIADFSVSILAENTDCFVQKSIIFSGLGKCGERLVNGEADLDCSTEISDEIVGNFTYLKRENNILEIGSDYFGTGKLYYYMKDDISVVTNNYHLLLLLLKNVGIVIRPNIKLIAALLCKSRQAFQQSISREREMLDVYMLPADKLIEVNEKGVFIKEKSISLVFNLKEDGETCEELLRKGKEEIVENTKIVLSDPRYEKVIVDLTGGLDSRLVYGAVSNLDEYKDKIVIHADGLDAAINQENSDLSIAVRVNCMKEYDYNTVYESRLWRDIDVVENEMISQSVLSGYYYPHSYQKMVISRKDVTPAFELNGFYGEICCRPYYTRKLLQEKEKYEDMDTLLSAIANRIGILSGSTYNELKNKLREELENLPGESLLEKWENHYLFYRNGLHCNTIWEYEKRTPQWGPLQSKALFKYKHLTYGKVAGAKEQLQIIQQMDPRLNAIPFADTQDEAERINFIGTRVEEALEGYSAEQIEDQKQRWASRRMEKKLNSKSQVEEGENYNDIKEKGESYDKKIEEKIMEILHILMKYDQGIFKTVFGLAVFKAMRERVFSLNEQKILYQKLVSVYTQIKIFES